MFDEYERYKALKELLDGGQIWLSINVNDIFCGAADCEEISEPKDLDAALDAFLNYKFTGLHAWVGNKRGVRPWRKIPEKWDEISEAIKDIK